MSKLRLATITPSVFLVCLFLGGAATATERIVRKDGSTLTGDVVGFRDGKYTVQVGRDVIEVPAIEVRTILDGQIEGTGAPASPEGGRFGVRDLLEDLTLRTRDRARPASLANFRDALAAVVRGEWDFALKSLARLHEQEPDWVDPQLLAGMIYAEQGNTRSALKIAKRVEVVFRDDVLAQRVVGEVYRRSGFLHNYALIMERVLAGSLPAPQLDYERAHLWGPIDAERARQFWEQYRRADPQLDQPWCTEGQMLGSIRWALGREDWSAAQVALGELRRRFPWVVTETAALQAEIMETRLRAAEAGGRLEEALLVVATLSSCEPERREEWETRARALQAFVLKLGLALDDVRELKAWARDHAYLYRTLPSAGEHLAGIAKRFLELGLRALRDGQVEDARLAFHESVDYDRNARPEFIDELLAGCVHRIRDDLSLGREARAQAIAHLLIDTFPDRRDDLPRRLERIYRQTMGPGAPPPPFATVVAPRTPDERRPPGEPVPLPGTIDPGDPGGGGDPVSTFAIATLTQYFPHRPGTRWVYRRGDGKREERRVRSVTPLADGGSKIGFEVQTEGESPARIVAYLTGRSLIWGAPTTPPGECALRYPVANQAHWSWQKDPFTYRRRVQFATEPIELPMGSYEGAIVVEADNVIVPPDGGKTYQSVTRVTYVPHVGVVRIESDNPLLERVLIQYDPVVDGDG